jgi:BlaI family transcriptional regulator, penicillinase repressor
MGKTFKQLTKAEEEIMQVLWHLGKAFIKNIVDELPEPKPHYNTVSTIVKILVEKKFVDYKSYGNTNEYFPLVSKGEYSKKTMKQLVSGYFGGSFSTMLSFFANEKDISIEELEEILKQLKKKPKI